MRFGAWTVLVLAIFVAGCGPQESAPDPDGTWVGTITTEGDVTTVINESGSVWGGTATLVEEMSIGVDIGAEEYMLGRIWGIAATDERIYLVDPSVPIVRVYDFGGRHLMNVGRGGQGPGEFVDPEGIAVASDSTIYVYDASRINVFSSSGESLETWPLPGFSIESPVMTHEDVLYLHDSADDGKQRMIATGPSGEKREQIDVPDLGLEPYTIVSGSSTTFIPFGPKLVWTMARSRAIIVGASTEYRFEIRRADGSVTIVKRESPRVPVETEEATWHRRRITDFWRRRDPAWRWTGPPIPEHRPAYLQFFASTDERIWVWRTIGTQRLADEDCDPNPLLPAGRGPRQCWRELYGFDVFDDDGRFLGSADWPEGVRSMGPDVVHRDNLISFVEDEDGVGMVKRYRLVLPGER